uniref:Uncharacterized protein n=1 Tax=Cajanus cajan TaxID=3821 RepID=A0A151S6P9_CAJCA|nr:hypothetical protein KK1_027716 [Cajanus cajan]
MCKMGFPTIWCTWIAECLKTSRMFVLVNGSPTEEFGVSKGLRQGDPLAPFLFIYVQLLFIKGVIDTPKMWKTDGVNPVISSIINYIFLQRKINSRWWMDLNRIEEEDLVSNEWMSSNCCKVIGNGIDTKFWLDKWVGHGILAHRFS